MKAPEVMSGRGHGGQAVQQPLTPVLSITLARVASIGSMRFHPLGVLAAMAALAIAGCSSGGEGGGPSSATPTTTTAIGTATHTPAPGAVEVSPGGVTTAVGADAESTEEEYSQACQAAKA